MLGQLANTRPQLRIGVAFDGKTAAVDQSEVTNSNRYRKFIKMPVVQNVSFRFRKKKHSCNHNSGASDPNKHEIYTGYFLRPIAVVLQLQYAILTRFVAVGVAADSRNPGEESNREDRLHSDGCLQRISHRR